LQPYAARMIFMSTESEVGYWNLRILMILSETLVKAKHQRDDCKRMSWDSWQYLHTYRQYSKRLLII